MSPHSLSLACSLAFAAVAGTAAASPPPNYSQQVYLCNSHLQAKVDITFGQTATQATSGDPRVTPTFTDQTAPTWAMTVTAAQDWDDEASFVNWLMDNAGETEIPVTLRPRWMPSRPNVRISSACRSARATG